MSASTFDDGSHRFSPISNDDHAGYVWIVTILGLIYSGLGGLARARIKWGVHGVDDYLLGTATVILFGQSSAVIYGLNRGLAKTNSTTPESDWALSGKSFFASEILSVVVLCLAKCSVVALIFRVFTIEIDRTWLLCLGTLIMSVVWGLGSMIAIVVNCDASTLLTTKEVTTCPSQFTRWQAITAVDVITEVLICALPVAFVWSTNMSRYIKFQVFLAFAFRLPLVYLSAAHLQFFKAYATAASSQPQFAIAGSLVLQQVMLTYSLISATIPNLKSFMKSFSVGLGVSIGFISSGLDGDTTDPSRMRSFEPYNSRSTGGGRSSQRRRSNHLALPPHATATATTCTTLHDPGDESEGHELRPIIFRPDQVTHEVRITKGSLADSRSAETVEDERAVSRSGSQDMIIKKEVVWNVYHEQLDGSSHRG